MKQSCSFICALAFNQVAFCGLVSTFETESIIVSYRFQGKKQNESTSLKRVSSYRCSHRGMKFDIGEFCAMNTLESSSFMVVVLVLTCTMTLYRIGDKNPGHFTVHYFMCTINPMVS